MDLNLVVLCGRLAAPPELRSSVSGGSQIRLLLAVRTDVPNRRLDLIPVVMWDPPPLLAELVTGERIWVSGMLQRRIRDDAEEAKSTSEVQAVAHAVCRRPVVEGRAAG